MSTGIKAANCEQGFEINSQVPPNEFYDKEFIPFIVRWGRTTNLLGFVCSFLPLAVLAVLYGFMPEFKYIIAGAIATWSAIAIFWVIEPISYFPILGIPGTYMAFLSGNISNLRLPCSAVAQESAGVKAGTNEGAIISTLGIGVSVIVNIVLLSIGAVAGTAILDMLPPTVKLALNYILPALFGAIFAQFSLAQPKLGVIALALGILMTWVMQQGYLAFLPGVPTYAVVIVCVFGTIFIARAMHARGLVK